MFCFEVIGWNVSAFSFKTFSWKGLRIELLILVIKTIEYGVACIKCYFIYVYLFISFLKICYTYCFYDL